MKLKTALLTLFIATTSIAHAEEPAPCSRLVGSWYGGFWFKDPKDCHRHHGCRHSMLAQVTHVQGTHYEAAVHPNVGNEGVYDLTCVNGEVRSADVPGVIMFSCIDQIICQIKYDDDKLSANVLSAGA